MMRAALIALLLAVPIAAFAVQPDEILPDPGLESRAREITGELRCVVCQAESLDESNADIARDLRLMVRERLVAGDTDSQVIDYVVDRYGEYVLFRPRFSVLNAPLWLAGPAFLLIGGGLAFAFIRSRSKAPEAPPPALSADEERRLAELTRE